MRGFQSYSGTVSKTAHLFTDSFTSIQSMAVEWTILGKREQVNSDSDNNSVSLLSVTDNFIMNLTPVLYKVQYKLHCIYTVSIKK